MEQYKRLRQRDGGGTTKSAWRITVRQLESMLRLSEAMARLYCSDEVSGAPRSLPAAETLEMTHSGLITSGREA